MSTLWKKLFGTVFIISGFAFLCSCGDLSRSNTLDPDNPDAEAGQVAVVENFVHRYTRGDSVNRNIAYSQEALSDLTEKYGNRLIVLEYHVTLSNPVPANEDTFSSLPIMNRYHAYRGTLPAYYPHAFFNGNGISLQGASSKESAANRYSLVLDTLAIKKQKIYCEIEKKIGDTSVYVASRIVKYGDESIKDLVIEYILYENLGDHLYYTVREIGLSESIPELTPQNVYEMPEKTFHLKPYYNANRLYIVMLIKNKNAKIIQACSTK